MESKLILLYIFHSASAILHHESGMYSARLLVRLTVNFVMPVSVYVCIVCLRWKAYFFIHSPPHRKHGGFAIAFPKWAPFSSIHRRWEGDYISSQTCLQLQWLLATLLFPRLRVCVNGSKKAFGQICMIYLAMHDFHVPCCFWCSLDSCAAFTSVPFPLSCDVA